MACSKDEVCERGRSRTGILRDLLLAGVALCPLVLGAAEGRAASREQLGPVLQAVIDMTVSQGSSLQGVGVGVSYGNGEIWLGAGGYRDIARTQPLQPTDQFRIGSHSKTFTGTAVLQLVDQGAIRLDDTLERWLPNTGIPNSGAITVRNLLNMTSGIPDYLMAASLRYPNMSVLAEWSRFALGPPYATADYTPEQLIQAVVQTPGQTYGAVGQMKYSNTNFALLGMIAQKASCATAGGCRSIETLVNSGVIQRLGMGSTLFPVDGNFTGVPVQNLQTVMPSDVMPGMPAGSYNVTNANPKVPWAAGSILSTPLDELTWIRQLALNNQNLLSQQTQIERLTSTVPGNVAYIPVQYGLAIYHMPSTGTGTQLVGHSGQIGGYVSSIFYDPLLDVAFSINMTGYATDAAPWYPLYGGSAYADALQGGNFNTVPILWALDRNLQIAMQAQGNCTGWGGDVTAAPATCAGDSVRTAALDVSGSLTVQPSGRGITNAVITNITDPIPQVAFVTVPRPSIAFFGSGMAGINLNPGASLILQPGSIIEMTGVNSAAVLLGGYNTVTASGTVNAYGAGSSAFGLLGSGSTLSIGPSANVLGDVRLGRGTTNTVIVDGVVAGNIDMTNTNTRLQGSGLITGTVGGGGRVAPDYIVAGGLGGGTLPQLTVGSYNGNNTVLEIHTRPGGVSNRLVVAGTADLLGGTLELNPDSTRLDGIYTVLTAGTVLNRFSFVNSIDRTAVRAYYGAGEVTAAAVNAVSFDMGVRTANAGIGQHLGVLQDRAALFGGSPLQVAARPGGTLSDAAGSGIEGFVPRRPVELRGPRGVNLWSDAFYHMGRFDQANGTAGIRSHGIGLALGADVELSRSLGVGAMAAYQTTRARAGDGNDTELDSRAYYAGLYGVAKLDAVTVDASLLAGIGDNDTRRPTMVLGSAMAAAGDYRDLRLAAKLGVSREVDAGFATLVPRLAASWSRVQGDGYAEKGAGVGALAVDSTSSQLFRAEASLGLRRVFDLGDGDLGGGGLLSELRVGVARDVELEGRTESGRVIAYDLPLSVDGYAENRWSVPVSARVEAMAGETVSLFGAYGGEFSSRSASHRFNAGLRVRF
ncbi:CubicO group peptidase (beta-lactamase class C family)/uncharacterized protein with beta-barrel porin domain [Azospirillum agricola]|uniref:serine hydrolase n=1 Tax=Azospirillum agricola TaxID=1720247 RepID=UPI001AE13A33|nr:serine hydrolase [Azospirillum agricola]MBP2227691.1 CubicO group peptidase (beta-lactamase class C family)/uncharacterized protein with beta-barrel porin domain [Azospirillum agricola]